ncbi:MAG: EAL domain-containing protein [Oscillospiraceae bacterium]
MEINSSVIKNVIQNEDIYTVFQPIVNIKSRRIVGVEALSRGLYNGGTINPYFLFEYAHSLKMTAKLDDICRKKAEKIFAKSSEKMMLFVNFDNYILQEIVDFDQIFSKDFTESILPENIVIEVVGGSPSDLRLMKFIRFCRQKGFLIAIDRVNKENSSLNLITSVRPDIVKIDSEILHDIDKDFDKKSIFNSIVSVANSVGATVIADGTETIEEVVTCVLCGVDFFQGFFFAKAMPLKRLQEVDLSEKLSAVESSMSSRIKQKRQLELSDKELHLELIKDFAAELSSTEKGQYFAAMSRFAAENDCVNCVFLLDENGVQITDTISGNNAFFKTAMPLFKTSGIGDTHSIKNYFYAVRECIQDPFVSDWYVSNSTGNLCKIASSKFIDQDGQVVIACIDIKSENKILEGV